MHLKLIKPVYTIAAMAALMGRFSNRSLAACVVALFFAQCLDIPQVLAGEATSFNIVLDDETAIPVRGHFHSEKAYLSRGGSALFPSGHGPHVLRYEPGLTLQGYYRVYLWWPQGLAPGSSVEVLVSHATGMNALEFDQSESGAQWNAIGDFQFSATNADYIEQAGDAGTRFAADAMRFEYLGTDLPPLEIATGKTLLAAKGELYHEILSARGGSIPYSWSAAGLPAGITLDPQAGLLSGTPLHSGRFDFSMTVEDSLGVQVTETLTLIVHDDGDWNSRSLATANESIRSEIGQITESSKLSHAYSTAVETPNLDTVLSMLQVLPEGEWIKVNENFFSDVWTPADLRPLKGAASNPTPHKIILAWSSFAWDRNRGDLLIYGGGHANYNGNDIYRWRGSTLMWERLSLPSEIMGDDFGNVIAIDGPMNAPTSAHTYDNNIFLPQSDRLVVFGGAVSGKAGPYKIQVDATTDRITGPYFFDVTRADANKVGGTTGSHVQRVAPYPEIFGGEMWENRDIYENIPENPTLPKNHTHGATAYVAENNTDVVYVSARRGSTPQNLFKYVLSDISDPTTDTMELVGRNKKGIGGQGSGTYDQARHIFVRSSKELFYYWDLSTEGADNDLVVFSPYDQTGTFAAHADYALDYDPVRDQYLYYNGREVWALKGPASPSAAGWTVDLEPTSIMPHPDFDTTTTTGILGKWKYIASLDAFMLLHNSTEGNIWIYKPIGWTHPDNLVDADADMMPDAYEDFYGLDSSDPGDALLDVDGDGLTARMESARGLDPLVPNVVPPVIVPGSGHYSDPVLNTITTATTGASIHYTIDGSVPSLSSPQYTGPFEVSTDSTIRAAAFKSGFIDANETVAKINFLEPPSGIIVDNSDTNTLREGTWQISGASDPWAGESLYSVDAASFRWLPALSQPGAYAVYAWWTYHKNRSDRVPYTIIHADGSSTVEVNQRNAPIAGQWVYLGSYNFHGNGTGYVEVASTFGQASADAVRLDPTTGSVNQPPLVTISWPPDDSVFTQGDSVTFEGNASDPEDGELDSSIAWISNLDGSLGSGKSVTTTGLSTGSHIITARIEDSGGATTEETVRLSVAPLGDIVELIIDNLDAATSWTGSWDVSGGPNPWAGQSVYNNGGSSFRWSLDILDAGNYQVYAWWTYHKNRSSSVPFKINHAVGIDTSVVDQRDASLGGKWVLLGSYMFTADSSHYVEVSSENGQASADAIRLVGFDPPDNYPPTVSIDSPDEAFTIKTVDSITLAGTAEDVEDGVISESIQWTSSLDGFLGSGSSATVTGLSVGYHAITAAVTDSNGESTGAVVGLVVNPADSLEIVVDDGDVGTHQSGTWKTSSGADPWGSQSLYNDTGSYFRWLPGLDEPGDYAVYAWWTYHKNRSSRVPYSVQHAGGLTTVIRNQNDPALAGRWVLLGVYTFNDDASAYIEVSSANGQASADAVKLIKH